MEICISRVIVYRQQFFFHILRNVSNRYLCSQKESSCGSSKNSLPKENESSSVVDSDSKLVSKAEDSNALSQEKVDRLNQENEIKIKNDKDDKMRNATHLNLMSVLSDIKVNEQSPTQNIFKLNLAKPIQRLGKTPDPIKQQLKKAKSARHGDDMVSAVKAVASSLGGDVQETAQQLAEKLVSIEPQEQKQVRVEKKKVKRMINKELKEKIETDENEKIMAAVQAVASTVDNVPGNGESELTKKLLSLAAEGQKSKKDDSLVQNNMMDLFEGMEIDRQSTRPSLGRKREYQVTRPQTRRNIFQSFPLDIFNLENKGAPQSSPQLLLWDKLQQKELKYLVQFAPTNGFEEMIQLTEQGKFWTFPINNEAGMTEEEKVGFHEHVFLDHLLEGFPKKGPIRHFMDLVINGLSKNPYISIQRKADHVQWFREYFAEKQDILKQYEIDV